MPANFRALFDEVSRRWAAGERASLEPLLRQILALRPRHPEALHLLGILCVQSGRLDEGIPLLEQAVSLKPYFVEAQANLGAALLGHGRPAEAEALLRQVLLLKPDHALSISNLARALEMLGRSDEALATYRRALQIKPDSVETLYRLAGALRSKGDVPAAIDACRKALALRPDFLDAANALGRLLMESGDIDEGLELCRRVSRLAPDHLEAAANVLTGMLEQPAATPAEVAQAHFDWARRFAAPITANATPHENPRDPDRPLRVGYLSPDLYQHAVSFFFEPLLTHHDRARFHTICYADNRRADHTTARLRAAAGEWRDTHALSDQQLAALIRSDRVDILVDLAGHTTGGRMLLFAAKPAPLQVAYLGYVATTGIPAIDYRLTDNFLDPPGKTEHFHAEKLLRLPDTFACYRPPDAAGDVGPLPGLAAGHITFGCFNAQSRVSPAAIDLWADLLARCPDARLLCVTRGNAAARLRRQLTDALTRRGLPHERAQFRSQLSFPEYLALHGQIDILLDAFPRSGHTVTCHALWMGVPVVTLAGLSYAQRLSGSVLSTLGMHDWIAASPEQYLDIARRAAADRDRLVALRAALRPRMAASPLTDAPRFAAAVEAAYRSIWRAHCST